MKRLIFTLFMMILITCGFAVLSDYSFTQTTGTYTALAAPTMLHDINIDDAMSPVTEIGFTFVYDDMPYTQFKANSNGFITLNTTSTASLGNALATQTLILGALWDDLKTDATDASVSYQLIGSAPNRTMVVQYKNLKWYYSATPVNLVNFQIVLTETSNTIKYIYGTMGAAPGTSASASIGLSGAVAGNFMSITPGAPATYSTTAEFAQINATHVPFLTGNVYTFSPPVAVPNDLQAMSLTGSTTPSSGSQVAYTINVRNRGSNPQSTYTVKLMSGATELASVAGPALAAGVVSPVAINYTFTATGPMTLTGKVVLTGDQNPANDTTSPLSINVQPAGSNLVIIGTGTATQRQPFGIFWGYERDASLYTQEQIGIFGTLSSVQWNCATVSSNSVPYNVYIKTTTDAALTAVPFATMIADAQLVATGSQAFSQTGWVTFPLNVPYMYTGGNLVVIVETFFGGTGTSPYPYFQYTTGATGSHQYWYADTTPPSGSGTLNALLPNIGLNLSAAVQTPQFAVSPANYNYNQVFINSITNKTFSIVNTGGGTTPLGINSISITGSPFFTLQSLPTLPASLPSFQSTSFVVRYNPTAAGTQNATVTIVDNLSRTPHAVQISGTCVDPQIYTLPYIQTFDTVTVPNLPMEMSKLAVSPANVTTVTTTPNSAPNCVYLYNSSATSGPYLISPPLVSTISLTTVRLRFWAKGAATYTLGIGVIADPLDAATFEQTASVTLSAVWAEYVVSFQTYTGQGHYIAIKHGNVATYQSIYIDDFNIELIANNDLAALSVVGNSTPSVALPTNYTVNLFNWGMNPQTNYTVKLYNGDNLELASVAGPTIAAGMSAQAVLSWTPTTVGPALLYGKCVLVGDQNTFNDQTPNKPVTVQPAGTIVVTVGDGSQTANYQPVDMYYKSSLTESIFASEELATGGNVNAIAFYNNFVTTTLTDKPTKVWLGFTDLVDLSAGWVPSTSLTLVFDGVVTYPAGQNTITIPLNTPYPYAGGNLVMMVQRPMDTAYFSSSDVFYCQTIGTNRARYYYSDSVESDPTAPLAGTLSGQFPKTSFFLTPADPNPHFSISPLSNTYSLIFINTYTDKTFNITNIGGGTGSLVINSIAISGSPMFTLRNLPTLPASLASFQSTTFVARYYPTAAGTHTATITITDNLGRSTSYELSRSGSTSRTQHTVALSGSCIDPIIYTPPYVQHFDTVTVPNLPIDWSKSFTSPATVTTVTTTPNSAPNCVLLANSSSVNGPYLISPPIANNIPIVTMRVKFWAKGAATYTLGVGIIADPLDTATFEQTSSVTLTAAWAEYVVSFQTYAGNGHYIAIKHGNVGTYQSIYIDDVTIEVTPANDLAAVSLAGTTIPVVGAQTPITVNLFNWGTNPQSTYTVKLYNATNLELASVPGTLIQPGTAAQVLINWVPTTAGAVTIYGKVVLAGDQNTLNDQTTNKNVVVQPAGTIPITVGDGSQTAYYQPVNMFYKSSLTESIFPAGDILGGGNLNSIAFYNNFVTTTLLNKPTKVWVGVSETADLSAGWIPSTALTLAFDGNVDYPAGQNMITIPLTTPFAFVGGNLVVMVQRPMDTAYYSTSDLFYCQTIGANRARYYYSDTTELDPATATGGTLTGQFPMTTFFFTSIDPNPHFAISPQSYNYGQVFINTTTNKSFSIMNIGGGANPLTISNITIAGSPFFTLQNLPTFPVSLTSGQTTSFVARYMPTAAGTHAATITVTDNLGRSQTFSLARSSRNEASRTQNLVQISATSIDPTIYTPPYTQNFDTVTVPALPIDWSKALATTTGTIVTSITTPNSAPNSVYMYNSSDNAGQIILVSPPITTTLPINTMRVKFWAKGAVGYTLGVGILSAPNDAGSFIETSNVTLTAAWAEYVVAFQTYTGQGHYMGFKHGLGGTYRGIYIDNVTIEVTPQNDLAALSVTGNVTPSVGMATNYTVNLFNWGTNPQSNYLVKLFTEGDIEVGSVAGPQINAGLAATVVVSWTPTVQGETYIYGKVVLTGDQNTLNDKTPNLTVSVQAPGIVVLTVGDGSQTARFPMDFFYKNSLNETLYLGSELSNTLGSITGITLYSTFFDDRQNMPTKIWMGTTELTDLSAGWIPSTSLTSVFDGTVNFPIGVNMIHITFPQPFLYLEGNLVVMFNRPMDTAYYSSSDLFYCQTVGTNRNRNIYSDTVTYDPAAPPTAGGTVTGQFPKTSFFIIPGGVGHLNGNVYGAGDIPLQNATVQVVNYAQTATNADGHYEIRNILPGTYQVTVSRYGYIAQTVSVTIAEDETAVRNFTLAQMPTVNVSGTIVGSDNLALGLAGATISLTGYENYTVTANAQGQFTITGVYTNQTYAYTAVGLGYQNSTGNITVGTTNHSMGNVICNEIAYTPRSVTSAITANNVTINWLAPDPNAVDITQGFENATFPPTDWTRVVTNNGAANPSGVYPTWCRFGTVIDATTTVAPSEGSWQCGFWWTYSHQDEWLISPSFNCPQGANLTFGTYVTQGSTNGDHYYVKVSNNNGQTWNVVWDASTLPVGVNNYQTPVQIDLSTYAGQQVKIAWHADDPNTSSDGMWYNWFIDNVVIGNNTRTIWFSEESLTTKSASKQDNPLLTVYSSQPMFRGNAVKSVSYDQISKPVISTQKTRNHSRSITGYKVWRLLQGQEQSEANWILLTTDVIPSGTLTYTDITWPAAAAGTYKWAIKAVYTNNVLSLGAFSNSLVKIPAVTGTLVGNVRNASNVPLAGATITAGAFTATTGPNGGYSITIPVGSYAVTCAKAGYTSQTQPNVTINANMPTTLNFTLQATETVDEVQVLATELKSNYPNPFNPETTIAYDVKVKAPVRIDIYNTKGQLIRTLVNQAQGKGHYNVVWNGKDNNGNAVASGVYSYRMQAGTFKATRMMMMMK